MSDPFLDLYLTIENRKKLKNTKSYTLKLLKDGEENSTKIRRGKF